MQHRHAACVLTAALVWSVGGAPSRAQTAIPRADQAYSTGTTAILVDVVVRDSRGRPVVDLSASDFEIAEDGVRQRVDTFTRVARGGGIGVGVAWRTPGSTAVTPTGPTGGAESSADEDGTTALVFDRLSSESLRLAQRATLEYVPMNGDSAARVGVFATDSGVRMVQGYTTDRSRVRRVVAGLVPSGTTAEEQHGERAEELLAQRRQLEDEAQALARNAAGIGGADLARNGAQLGEREMERRLVQTELNMIRAFESMDRDHQGYDTAAALLTVVQSLSYRPGRKTIVFFSEGLPVSPVLSAKLDAVIEAANRAHVTTYTVDAKGLRTRSSSASIRKEMQGFVDERNSQLASGTDMTHQPLSMAFERVEDTFKLESRTGLARLAEETGGFLIEQTNNLTSAFRRIDEDNRFHYLLTYTPTNTAFDGKFRSIAVDVRRPGAQVFARKGYRAARSAPPALVAYDVPVLAMLDRAPLPRAFPMHAAAFSFPDPARPGLTPVILRVATSDLRFVVDKERASYTAHAVVVVRIRDGAGREVERLSQEYLLTGNAADVEAGRKGEILFYREPQIPSGLYTVESIVYDGNTQQASARVATLTVPPTRPTPAGDATPDAEPALGMSSLVILDRTEEVSAGPSAAAPFLVGRTLLYPNLGQPIRPAANGELTFFFTLYGTTDHPTAIAQLLRNGGVIAEAPVPLAADLGPRVQHLGRLPIAALPAGTYELRIRVESRSQSQTRNVFFTIER
jgi:VWFA-related protein